MTKNYIAFVGIMAVFSVAVWRMTRPTADTSPTPPEPPAPAITDSAPDAVETPSVADTPTFTSKTTVAIKNLDRFQQLSPRSTATTPDPTSPEAIERQKTLDELALVKQQAVIRHLLANERAARAWLDKMEQRIDTDSDASAVLEAVKATLTANLQARLQRIAAERASNAETSAPDEQMTVDQINARYRDLVEAELADQIARLQATPETTSE